MNGKVHGMAGMFVGAMMMKFFPQDPLVSVGAVLGGAIMGKLADLDHAGSSLAHKPGFNVAAQVLSIMFKHRGFTHSLAAIAIVWFALSRFEWNQMLIISLVMSYASHLLLDMFNESGVQLLWPLKFKPHFLPESFSISSRWGIGQAFIYYLLFLSTLIICFDIFSRVVLHELNHFYYLIQKGEINLMNIFGTYNLTGIPIADGVITLILKCLFAYFLVIMVFKCIDNYKAGNTAQLFVNIVVGVLMITLIAGLDVIGGWAGSLKSNLPK